VIDATNRNTALASALTEELFRSGVRDAVICPGSRSSPLALALDAIEIETTVLLDERSAAFFALGIAIAERRPVAITCTSGSAAANFHPAVVEADQAGIPLLVLTNDRPPELRGIGAGQTIDQIGLYGSAARWFCEAGVQEADDAGLLQMRSIACRAVAEATGGRGPVHLNLSWRDPLGPEPHDGDVTATTRPALEGRSPSQPLTALASAREPGEWMAKELAGHIAGAQRALIVCGRQLDPGLREPVAALAAAAGMPILAEPISQLRFGAHAEPDGDGAVISAYDLIVREPPEGLRPDLVLRFGDMPTSKALRGWLAGLGDIPQLVVDPPGRWNEPTRIAAAMIRCDAAALAKALAAELEGAGGGEWLASWQRAEAAAQEAIDEVLAEQAAISEPAVHRALAEAFADGERVLVGSSMPVRDQEAFARGRAADVLFASNRGANGIDGTISTGAGLSRGCEAGTWIVLGDLALAHDLGGLQTLAAGSSPLRIVVIDNGGGGIFDFLPQAGQVEGSRFERLFTTPSELDLEKVAGLFGLDYVAIDDAGQIAELRGRGRVLAHARVDRGANVALHRRLAAAVAAAI
jgi:2-succinyl-5-enolpyruvyl-6-hydroxy-3-cyclohexene-1-carboxylate synthase